ncbi:MFS transporter [Bradyrhizobium prioriisuperbiae]|uniref:MFS transporter n=1 Tax=Bradyrhizobium prioriisuperbiae TaxID=2854389 RepID=UPI0028E927BD|nr:MFS transporter [Bradyrhizobium prioritasuperba]
MGNNTNNTEAPKATRREWIGLAVIALPCLLYAMDLTVLNLAVPHLSADLKPSSSQLLWIVDIYGFMVAGSLMTMGTLGDRIGRRRLLLIGAAAFGVTSVIAAFSTTANMLIASRALLGVAAATLAPSTLSLISNMFRDPKQRTFAIGVWVASFSTGGAIGPLIGGVLLTHFWWGSVFLANVPVMLLLLVLGPLFLPEFRDPNAGRLDPISAILSLIAVLATIYGIKRIAEYGVGWPAVLTIVAGLAVGAVFIRRQQTLPDPLMDLRLFRSPIFSAALAISTFSFFVGFASFLFIAQYLQLVLRMTPLDAGLWTAPSGLAFIAGSMIAPAIAHRIRPVAVLVGGLVLAAIGFGILTQIGGSHALAVVVTGFVIFSLGLSPVVTMTTDLVIGAVPPERAGMASGLSETSSEFGGALGIAMLGSLITAIYRGNMAGASLRDIPPDAMDTARSTLGGALAVAEQLPGALGADLLHAAQQAFSQALIWATGTGAAILLATALVAFMLLWRAVPGAGVDIPVEPAALAGSSKN